MFSSYHNSIQFLKSMLLRHKRWSILFFIEIVGNAGLGLLLPYFARIETDQLVQQGKSLRNLIHSQPYMIFVWILVLGVLCECVEKIFQAIMRYFRQHYEKIFDDDYFLHLYQRLKYLELGIYANKKNQDLFSKILGDNGLLEQCMRQIGDVLSLLVFLIGGYGLLAQIDWKIGIALVVGGLSYYGFAWREQKLDVWRRFDSWDLERALRNVKRMVESDYHKLVYVGGSKLVLDTMNNFNQQNRAITQSHQKKRQYIEIARSTIDTLIIYAIKAIVGRAVFQWTASVGTMAMTIALFHRLSSFIAKLVSSKQEFENAREKLAILELYLDATKEKPSLITQDFGCDTITLSNLSFRYPSFSRFELEFFDILLRKISKSVNQSEYELNQLHTIQEAKKNAETVNPLILHNINMQFEKGKVYGIVGKNGAGKTTLMHLLMDYFQHYEGSIKRGNHEQKDIGFDFFEQHIAVIEQDPFLMWGFTIKQNLLVGVTKSYSDDELYALLDRFGLKQKILELRKGRDTLYSYDINFSGGQNQLLSLLRVYLQDKPIMILDEGTNQLDAENEAKIMQLLLEQKKDKIILMISHRMTTLQKADYLYCLEDGKISDQGTPQALRKTDSLFARFWKEQVE